MDLIILHALETFREGSGAFLNSFFYKITSFTDNKMLPVLLALVYWCISKEFGSYLLLGYHWNRLVNGFAKITVCAYRPWIRDPSLVPDSNAITGATGYSFPSGHSMNGATIFGGIAVRKDMSRDFRIVGWIMAVLVAFSRIYMSVHTPQDVVVGLAIGSFVMYAAYLLMPKILSHKNGDLIAACITLAVAALIAIYASLKSYPVDYDADGKILVEGSKMAVDTFKAVGWNCGFWIGWILEKRYVKFTSDGNMAQRSIRAICGLMGYYFFYLAIVPLIKNAIGGTAGTVVECFLQMLYIVLLFPLCVKLYQKKKGESISQKQ